MGLVADTVDFDIGSVRSCKVEERFVDMGYMQVPGLDTVDSEAVVEAGRNHLVVLVSRSRGFAGTAEDRRPGGARNTCCCRRRVGDLARLRRVSRPKALLCRGVGVAGAQEDCEGSR